MNASLKLSTSGDPAAAEPEFKQSVKFSGTGPLNFPEEDRRARAAKVIFRNVVFYDDLSVTLND